MPLYKVLSCYRNEKKCLVAASLDELKRKAAQKMQIESEGVRFVIDKDGMEVDDDEVLEELSGETFMLLQRGQFWKCAETLVLIEGTTDQSMLADSKQTNPSDHITATPALSVSTVSETPKALVPSSSGCSLGMSDQTRVVYNTSATIAKEPSPNFSPLIQRHLEERTIDVVWNKFIGETANYYYGKFPNIDSTDQYRAIGEKMYTQYPCIKNEGNQPWSLFTKCLSQRIRHMRLRLKRKSQPEIPNSNPKPKSAKTFKTVEREQGPEEDEKAHIKELGEEWKKSAKKRNSVHIRTLLNETRRYREKLVQKSPRLLKEIVSAVPCFTEGEFIVYEFKRKYGKEKLEAMCRNMEILVLACHDLMGKPLEKNSLKSEVECVSGNAGVNGKPLVPAPAGVAVQCGEDENDRLCEPDIPVCDTSPIDVGSLLSIAASPSKRQVDVEVWSGVCESNKKIEMFSVQCQVPYNLVKRKHAAVQENPTMCTKEVQTEDFTSIPVAARQDIDSTFNSSIYSHRSKDDPEWLPQDDSFMSECSTEDDPPKNEAKQRKFIVFESEIDKLLRYCKKCNSEVSMEKFVSGTFLKVKTVCAKCEERDDWCSQPMSGSMAFGNLILGAAILFAGLSPAKVVKMFNFAGIASFCERAYNVYQRVYYVPSVMSVWTSHQARMADNILKENRKVRLGGDCCDSPGHTAKYGSYTVLDLERNKILDCQLVQSNEVKNSYWMELEGLKRCLQYLSGAGIQVSHLVTDRHLQVKKYMREEQPTIVHWFDVWHVAKGIFKKLQAVGKKKGCEKVLQWARSISNHLYWCAASSDGDDQLLTEKWLSILNHIQNVHTGHGERFPECLHETLENRLWMKRGYRPYQETEKVVASKLLLKDIGKLSPAEQTSSLEAFHKVVCQFAPKFVHYDHPQMEARLCIASLHSNENANQAQATKRDGSLQFAVSYQRGRSTGVAKEVKVEMTYDYVDELMAEVLFTRETSETHSVALEHRLRDESTWPSAGDGSRLCPIPLAQSTPYKQSKTELVQNRISRFNR